MGASSLQRSFFFPKSTCSIIQLIPRRKRQVDIPCMTRNDWTTTRTRSRGTITQLYGNRYRSPLQQGKNFTARASCRILFFSLSHEYVSEERMELRGRGRRGHYGGKFGRDGYLYIGKLIWEGKNKDWDDTGLRSSEGNLLRTALEFFSFNCSSLFCYLLLFFCLLPFCCFGRQVCRSLFAHGLLTLLHRSSYGMFFWIFKGRVEGVVLFTGRGIRFRKPLYVLVHDLRTR